MNILYYLAFKAMHNVDFYKHNKGIIFGQKQIISNNKLTKLWLILGCALLVSSVHVYQNLKNYSSDQTDIISRFPAKFLLHLLHY